MADNSVLAQIDENQLMDIELPIAPGIDWVGLLQWTGIGLITLLLLFVVFWTVTHYWLRVRLQWQLRQGHRRLKQVHQQHEMDLIGYQLYQQFIMAKRHQLLAVDGSDVFTLKINQACFSKTQVSRETLIELFQLFDEHLAATRPSLKIVFIKGLTRVKSWLMVKGREND